MIVLVFIVMSDVAKLPVLVPVIGTLEEVTLNCLLLTPSHMKFSVPLYFENEHDLKNWHVLFNTLVADAADVRIVIKQGWLQMYIKKAWKRKWYAISSSPCNDPGYC